MLISAVLRTGDMQGAIRLGATHRLFHVYPEEWQWMEKRYEKGRTNVDKAAFRNRFPDFKIIRTDDVEEGLDSVKESHANQCLQVAVEQAVELIENGKSDEAVRLIHRESNSVIYDIEHTADAVDVFTDWQDSVDEFYRRYELQQETGHAGVPTGITSLDNVTGGLQAGWLMIVGARLGVGKSWTLLRMAYGACVEGYSVLFFSLEQTRHEVTMRMHSFAAADLGYTLNPSQLGQGRGIDPERYEEILSEIQGTMGGQFLVNDSRRGRVSAKTIEAAIEAKQPDIVFVDYLGLMDVSGYGRADHWQALGELSATLKAAAEKYEVPIVAAQQLNRSGAGNDPGNEVISGSDKIGQDADLILMLTEKTDHTRWMKLTKNRHGASGTGWHMEFDPAKGVFNEITGNRAQDIMDKDLDDD